MKLPDLKKAIKKFASAKKKGNGLKAKKLRKTLDGLKQKQKKFERNYAKESSSKAKNKLELKLKVVKAQIKKGRQLLKKVDT